MNVNKIYQNKNHAGVMHQFMYYTKSAKYIKYNTI